MIVKYDSFKGKGLKDVVIIDNVLKIIKTHVREPKVCTEEEFKIWNSIKCNINDMWDKDMLDEHLIGTEINRIFGKSHFKRYFDNSKMLYMDNNIIFDLYDSNKSLSFYIIDIVRNDSVITLITNDVTYIMNDEGKTIEIVK